MIEKQKIYMSWDKFDTNIEEFIQFLKDRHFLNNSVILALKRGSFPSATSLSNKLDIPISIISFQTRDGKDSKPIFLEPHLLKKDSKYILVDDIYDTGFTVETSLKALEKNYDISMDNVIGLFHYGEINMFNTMLKFYKIIESNLGKWVVFPWEKR